jgi:hypothetical protein
MSAGIDRLEPASRIGCSTSSRLAGDPADDPILAQAAAALADKPEYAGRIADILEKAAVEQRIRQDPAVALDLYRRLLALVPDARPGCTRQSGERFITAGGGIAM